MQASQPSEAAVPDNDELTRFREQWKEEVRKKKGQPTAPRFAGDHNSPGPPSGARAAYDAQKLPPASLPHTVLAQISADPAPAPRLSVDPSLAPIGKTLSRAVEIYRRAIQCEQQSNLDEALELYRSAFRLDPNVDRAYHKLEAQSQHALVSGPSTATAQVQKPPDPQALSGSGRAGVDAITDGVKALDIHSAVVPAGQAEGVVATKTLASLIASWPQPLTFEPEDEGTPTPIQRLPDEILIHILRTLDTLTIERFASVNRKARVVTLEAGIWRDFVQAIYKPPQIPDDQDMNALLHQYMADYRRLYIEQPRLRLDGVYIAVCHYIRAGLSENAWVNVSHLITYHRYLRFFPNGQVLSLLLNEDMPPQEVISLLKPTLRMKGLSIGSWQLVGNTVHVTSLLAPSAGSGLKYAFQMVLELRSRPLGRWNRLEFRTYESVDIETGEATAVPLKHERPYWFSKVKSYNA